MLSLDPRNDDLELQLNSQIEAPRPGGEGAPPVGLVPYREGPSAFPSPSVLKDVGPALSFCARAHAPPSPRVDHDPAAAPGSIMRRVDLDPAAKWISTIPPLKDGCSF